MLHWQTYTLILWCRQVLKIKSFRKTKTIYSHINFHIVFCTRFKRKLFLDSELSLRVGELIGDKCRELSVNIIKLQVNSSSVEMIIECPPDLSPNQLVFRIKSHCNVSMLEKEFLVFERIPNLWTRSYLISTDTLGSDTIKSYISSQKSR